MKHFVTVIGPPQAGPGERALMLRAAEEAMGRLEVDDVTRIDVPGRGSGDDTGDSGMRTPVAVAVPALQSGSLFGGRNGLLVVDANQLLKIEATVIAEIVERTASDAGVAAVFVSSGAIPAPLGKVLRTAAEKVEIRNVRERDAIDWVSGEARRLGLRLDRDATAALIQRFGSDVGAIGGALEQLAVDDVPVTADQIRDRFKNRPDEPMWHYTDALAAGDTAVALRRLGDFLIHGHPLQLLGALQGDVRRRAIAAGASDYDTFIERSGGRAGYAMQKVWKQRNRMQAGDLRLALGALARADIHLKTTPEPTHRVTLERLTVAMCRWYGGR